METLRSFFGGGSAQVAPEAEDEENLISVARVRSWFSSGDTNSSTSEPNPQREGMLAMLGLQQPREYCGIQLTWKQRLYGCLITLGIGVLLTLLAIFALFTYQFVSFGILYTFGSVCSIICTGFIVGPMTQLRWMFKEKRIFATCAYLGSIILTFVAAFAIGNFIIVLLCVVLQFCALGWYIYTYIVPF